MAKKVLMIVAAFYLLGVFGAGGGYLSQNWNDDWGIGDQVVDAVRIGIVWPLVVIELVGGA